MLFDSHHLHVALGPGPPRCAGPAGPSPPSPPSCRRRPTHHGCSPWNIARTQEGCSFFQLCASTTIVTTSPSRPLWPGPPRCASPSPPRRLHRPGIAIAQLTTGVRQGASPAPGRGATFFHPCVSTTIISTSPSPSRAGSAALHGSRCPSSPSPPSCRRRTAHHGCSPRSITTGVRQGRFTNPAPLPQHQGPQRRPAQRLLQPGHRALTTPLQLPEHWDWAFTAAQLLLPGPGPR